MRLSNLKLSRVYFFAPLFVTIILTITLGDIGFYIGLAVFVAVRFYVWCFGDPMTKNVTSANKIGTNCAK